jgi:mannose-1-phosphate guanylyltransferase / mannose-6-phosphate isomerase
LTIFIHGIQLNNQTHSVHGSAPCLIPTILCGGVGSRLWPVSREQHPKPFIRLADGQSLLQKAYLHGSQLLGVQQIITVTNRELFFKIADEFRLIDSIHVATSFILEPFGKNTAPAIVSATLEVMKTHGPDAILLVLAADHLIADHAAFQQAVTVAMGLAQTGKIVTFGIKPNTPETGYGYIEADGHSVLRFVEKPALATAKEYLAAGTFLWNSGIFCFTAATMLEQMAQHCPEILAATKACIAQSRRATGDGFSELELNSSSFQHVPDISIDYAVLEKSKHVAVVPCDIGWSDIGSWSALGDLDSADSNGNRIQGEAILHNTRDCTIQSNDRLVGAVGLENIIIINTPDAVLVANKEHAQDVKHIYAQLKLDSHETHKLHRTVQRPWGTYTVLEEGAGFKLKRIEVKAGASLSLQMHHHRSEHWVVIAGVATVINGEQELTLNTNESTFIPRKNKHRLTNHGATLCVLIEVQIGDYLGEDDIVRFEDVYGRVPTL